MGDAAAALAPLALSSMYAQRWADRASLAPFFALGRSLGFDRFELSHDVPAEALAAIAPGSVQIASVHHPCPTAGAWVAGGLVSGDRAARAAAVAALRTTIATAERVGAPVVVLHLGRAADDADETARRLRFEVTNRFLAGQAGSERSALARDRLAAWVAAREPEHLEHGIASLREVLPDAAERGIALAVETGYHPDELPTPEGLRALLDALGAEHGTAGAWLDTGHVGARAALGFAAPEDWRAAAGGRWLGAHVHDAVGLRDHLAPGSGTLDLVALLAMVPGGAPLTLEVDWHLAPDEVADAARHVLALRARPDSKPSEHLRSGPRW